MLRMIGHAVIGLVIGIVAKLLLPGADPGGLLVTALIGMVGAWLGGLLGHAFGWYKQGESAGLVMSVIGAMLLLLAYRFIA
jgi:uncharacterized membrane protein YeaQ/YmgE (transglycosylase-associated protein family)